MKKVFCDRCGKDCSSNAVDIQVEGHGVANDLALGVDLCPGCTAALKKFFDPIERAEAA